MKNHFSFHRKIPTYASFMGINTENYAVNAVKCRRVSGITKVESSLPFPTFFSYKL